MKVRMGFVSNSSSSSFVLIGSQFNIREDKEDIMELLDVEYDPDDEDFDIYNSNLDEKNEFDVEYDYDNEDIFIGKHIMTGEGYGVDYCDIKKVEEALNSEQIKKLKEKYQVRLFSVVIGE